MNIESNDPILYDFNDLFIYYSGGKEEEEKMEPGEQVEPAEPIEE